MSDYFRQVLVHSGVIAFLATLLIHLPWAWAKIFLAILLIVGFILLGNNPLFFYRKLFRAVVLASIGSLVLGVNAQFAGNAALPWGLGAIKFLVDMGSGSPLLVFLILAVCVGADFGAGWLANRTKAKLLGSDKVTMKVWNASKEGLLIVENMVLAGRSHGLTLTGADLRIRAWGAPRLETRLLVSYEGGAQTDIDAGKPARIERAESLPVSIDARAAGGLRAAYIGKRLLWVPRLVPVSGRLAFRREAGARAIVLEVELAN